MLAVVVAALVAAQAPGPAPAAGPPTPRPPPPGAGAGEPASDACLALVRAGKRDEARACDEKRAAAGGDDATIARVPGPVPPPDGASDASTSAAAEPAEAAPAPATRLQPATPAAEAQDASDACLALVRAGKRDEARACYEKRAAAGGDDAKTARDLADLVGGLRLKEPALATPTTSPGGFDFGSALVQGKVELIATSALAGGAVLTLETAAALSALGPGPNGGSTATALLLLMPVLGGGAGLVGSAAAVVLVPQMTPGDANAIRAFEVLGGFEAVMFPLDVQATTNNLDPSFDYQAQQELFMLGAGGLIAGATAAGVAVAVVTDLPEGAGSMALSGALWSSVLVVLGADMAQGFKTDARSVPLWLTAAGNLGFAGGLLLSTQVPLTRPETWAVDLGGGAGLAAGAALAFYGHAPNPFVGWGAMALGTTLGMAGGFAVARYVPPLLDGLPPLVAVAPLAIPDGRAAVLGGSVMGRF